MPESATRCASSRVSSRGVHLSDRSVRRWSAPWFRLETDVPWPVEADGDHIGTTPLEGRVLPGAIRFLI